MLYRCPGFAQSEEAAPIERLLDAYYECDQDAAELVTKSPLFKFMENDVSCTVHWAEELPLMCTSKYVLYVLVMFATKISLTEVLWWYKSCAVDFLLSFFTARAMLALQALY